MASSYKITEVLGIPIRVHITLLIFLPILGSNLSAYFPRNGWFWGLLSAVGLFASVTLHELGHSAVAQKYGCRVRDILLIPFGGMAQLESMPRNPMQEVWIAAAGPAVSMALAIGSFALYLLMNILGMYSLAMALGILGGINLMLALFNLLPSFPMDGGRIFRALMTPRVGRLEATRRAAKIGRGMAWVFGFIGLFNGHFMLIAIAVFIYFAAGSEYRMVAMQESTSPFSRGPGFGFQQPPPRPNVYDHVVVSPPPYETPSSHRRRSPRDWFDDLARDWSSWE